MADTISPCRHQYVGHWLTGPAALWPLRAGATASTEPVTPVPDKYAFQATDKQTNKQTER